MPSVGRKFLLAGKGGVKTLQLPKPASNDESWTPLPIPLMSDGRRVTGGDEWTPLPIPIRSGYWVSLPRMKPP